MSHHVVFLERDSLKAHVRRPRFEHTYEEYAHTPSDQISAAPAPCHHSDHQQSAIE